MIATERRFDTIVVGAGMVGAALAALLARGGLRVALVEAAPLRFDWPAGSADLRVSALTAASERIFSAIGAWPGMAELGISAFREMHVWDARGSGEIHFDSADIGEARLGHIVENRVVQRVLIEGLSGSDNVQLFCPVGLERITVDDGAVRVGLSDGGELTAPLVVGADGANSRVRSLGGIEVRGWDYDQRGLVATVTTELPHRCTAWQRFLPEGPLAFLPLRDGRSSIVWSTSPGHADALLAAEDAPFLDELSRAIDYRLGKVIGSGPRAAFPLRLQHARAYVAPRLALIGDAAHSIHPLAGQGVNLGLLDAAALAEVLIGTAAAGRDPGGLRALRRYERWRKGDNVVTMMAMDGFKRLFGATLPPLQWARNAGLEVTNAAAPVKNLIMQYAMGLRGDLPLIARGARV